MSLEEWIGQVTREPDPEASIEIWEDIEIAYRSFCNGRDLPLDTRKEVFEVAMMRSVMPNDRVLARIEPKYITMDDVKSILAAYPSEQ